MKKMEKEKFKKKNGVLGGCEEKRSFLLKWHFKK